MALVAIVTDTVSCLPAALIEQYHVRVVPVGMVIDKKVYLDNGLTNNEF
jgi:fatty acid-binding protein DegV